MAACLCIAILALLYKRKDALVPLLHKHRSPLIWGLLLTLFYLMLSQGVFWLDPRPVGDNYSYAFPYFNYLFQSFATTGTPPLWNPLVNHGEPTFLFINHTFLLHLPYIPFYLLAPYLNDVDPYHVFWAATLLADYLQALGIAFLVFVLTRSSKVALFAMAIALLSGISVGELHQMQVNASTLYVPWALGFLILWYRSENKIFWYLFWWFFGFSLINHYPHLVIYFWSILGASWMLMHRKDLSNAVARVRRLRLFHFSAGVVLCTIIALPTLWIFIEYSSQLLSPYRGQLGQSLSMQYEFITKTADSNSLNLHTLIHFFFPQGFMAIHGLGQTGVSDNIIFYIGILPLFFAGYCLYSNTDSARTFKLALLLVLLLGMGAYSFAYFFLYNYIPFANMQRIPLHVANYFSFLLIILASQGLCSFTNEAQRQVMPPISKKVSYPAMLAAIVFFIAAYYLVRQYKSEMIRVILDDVVILCIMVAVFVWLDIHRNKRGFWIVLALFLVFDLGRFYHLNFRLEQQPRQEEFATLPIGEAFFSWKDGIERADRFNTVSVYHALLLGQPMFTKSGRELVLFSDYSKFRDRYPESFKPEGTDTVFSRRVYLLSPNRTSLIGAQDDLSTILKKETLPLDFVVAKALPDDLDLRVTEGYGGRLVWLDHGDKGWSVEVNGKNADIIPFGPFKSVVLGEGVQEVRWMYRPFWRWFIWLDLALYLLFPVAIFIIVHQSCRYRHSR